MPHNHTPSRLAARPTPLARLAAGLQRRTQRLRADRRGNIAIMVAIMFPVLVGVVALSVNLAQVYTAKARIQNIADQSALAAAYSFNQTGSQANATEAALSLAEVNGLASGSTTVTASLGSSPINDGNSAESVSVTSTVPLVPFASAYISPTISVTATAYSEIENRLPCIETVNYGITSGTDYGIQSLGSVNISATDCNISSSGAMALALGGGTGTITASKITADGTITNYGSLVINAPQVQNTSAPTDLYAGVRGSLFTNMASVSGLTAPSRLSLPTTTGGTALACGTSHGPGTYAGLVFSTGTLGVNCNITFTGGAGTTTNISPASSRCPNLDTGNGLVSGSPLFAAFCIQAYATGAGYTTNFLNITLGAGTYNIGGLATSCGTIAIITNNTNPTINIYNGVNDIWCGTYTIYGTATLNISGGINHFAQEPMYICGGPYSANCYTNTINLTVDGGIHLVGSFTFGNGNVTVTYGDSIGPEAPTISGVQYANQGTGIDLQGGYTASFGDGNFNIAHGMAAGGGANISFGHSNGGCSTFKIPTVAPTGSNSLSAGYAIDTGGGGAITFVYPCANVWINGNMQVEGNWYMNQNNGQASTWTINGSLWVGGNSSVSGSCALGGSNWTGTLVQIVMSGTFCIGAGYVNINLTPQTTLTSATIGQAGTVILATDSNASDAIIDHGAALNMQGAMYVTYEPLLIVTGASISGNGGCLILIAADISIQSGSSITSNCSGVQTSTSNASVSVVQ
jgi:Flp pilus assembly protein TadG